ncbi:hypothetical protein Bpfe_023935, partial [Biomphalaria pfeifferi]
SAIYPNPNTWSHTTSVPITSSTENCEKPCCFKEPAYNQNYQTSVFTLEYQQHYQNEYYQPYSPGTPEAMSIPRPSDKRSYRLLL